MTIYNVCHVSTMTNWGGVEWILRDYLTSNKKSSFFHMLMTTSSSSHVMKPLLEAKVSVFQPERKFHFDPRSIFQMSNFLKLNNVRLVHGYNVKGVAWGGLASFLANVPVFIGGEHGSVWSVKSLDFLLNYLAYKKSNIVLVNSKAAQRLICYRYKINQEKVRILYNLVGEVSSKKMNILQNEFRLGSKFIVGSIGRLVPQKGYDILIESAKEICSLRKDIAFVVIGGGDEFPSLQKKIFEHELQENFFLTGWRDNARDLLQEFDIFVSTSIFEPFGNVLIEAAKSEIPVIAPRVDGIPEAVEDGETGILIQPTIRIHKKKSNKLPSKIVIDSEIKDPHQIDSKELSKKILFLIENPSLMKQLGENGKKRANSLFSLERYSSELENIYKTELRNTLK